MGGPEGFGGLGDLPRLDDELLVARAADGDEDAFAILVHRHTSPLLALAHGMLGNRADAEEAVQDALVGAWRRLPDFRGDATFRTWTYRIVTNRCLSVLRRRVPAEPLDAVPEPATLDAGGQPARAAESAATKAALSGALRKLRADQRACWILRELQGLSYGEIAQAVGTSEQTVRGRLFRARCNLMEEMAPWR
ncbi:RNA polymerase sigma factor [Streptomyces sp. 8L]|uniref:RNA polymerase sigma factor n=1 Tax=Streptomyces sp. 8L TaxID=2877242 RepID=UPI0027E0348A|nr:sigma-70 family RNA polymerase sigma factor [Streptomyces sp. 8L]